MEDIKFSVIVPVYNVEQYLRECVDSVLAQKYDNFEVILVDDGSPDNCPAICDYYSCNNSRIITLHQQNRGLSEARNAGTRIASGQYVLFLDSDDYWIGDSVLERLSAKILTTGEPDVVFFRRSYVAEKNHKVTRVSPPINSTEIEGRSVGDAMRYLVANDLFSPNASTKCIRAEIAKRALFRPGIFSEDIDQSFALALLCESYAAINDVFYAYRRREGSITANHGVKNVGDLLTIIEFWEGKAKCMRELNLRNSVLGYCCYQLSIALAIAYGLNDNEAKKTFMQRIERLDELWKFAMSPKSKKAKAIVNTFGLRIAGFALNRYMRLKRP